MFVFASPQTPVGFLCCLIAASGSIVMFGADRNRYSVTRVARLGGTEWSRGWVAKPRRIYVFKIKRRSAVWWISLKNSVVICELLWTLLTESFNEWMKQILTSSRQKSNKKWTQFNPRHYSREINTFHLEIKRSHFI